MRKSVGPLCVQPIGTRSTPRVAANDGLRMGRAPQLIAREIVLEHRPTILVAQFPACRNATQGASKQDDCRRFWYWRRRESKHDTR